jgi:hypothetical protein
MDRDHAEQVKAHLHELEYLVGDPPPLLTLVVLSDGSGLRHKHPLLLKAEAGTLDDAYDATRLVRALLVDVVAHLDEHMAKLTRATHNVVDSL